MRLRFALGPLALVLLLGCGASTAKPADAPDGEKLSAPPTVEDPEGGAAKKTDAPAAPTMGAVKREGSATDVVDDYSLTENDCQALGRRYGDTARSDQRVALSPKLTDKQREQANASIDPVVAKLETGWIDVCSKSLAGKNVDHAKITCALAAKTVKGFDTCLNGDVKK